MPSALNGVINNKEKNMKKNIIIGFVTLLSICILFDTGIAQAKPKNQIKIKVASFLFADDPALEILNMYIDKVNQQAEGRLVLRYIGGPEIVNEFELGNTVANGVIDMAFLTAGFYFGNAAGVEYQYATRLNSEKLRKNGYFDFANDLHRKGNLELIGFAEDITDFWYIFLKKPVKQLSDLKGMRLGDGTTSLSFLKTVGASSVTIGMPEAYTALERGVIDGILWPRRLIPVLRLHEVLKYYIDAPFYRNDINYIMNLDRWKSIPEDLQKIMKEAAIEIEKETASITRAIEEKAANDIATSGIIKIQFSQVEAQKTVDLLYTTEWDQAIKRYPEIGPKLKKYLSNSNN